MLFLFLLSESAFIDLIFYFHILYNSVHFMSVILRFPLLRLRLFCLLSALLTSILFKVCQLFQFGSNSPKRYFIELTPAAPLMTAAFCNGMFLKFCPPNIHCPQISAAPISTWILKKILTQLNNSLF